MSASAIHQWRGPNDPGWSVACLEYFKAKYRQRLEPYCWANGTRSLSYILRILTNQHSLEPFTQIFGVPADPSEAMYHLPETALADRIMPNLLNDRLFFLALFSSRYGWFTNHNNDHILWEMYGTNPGCLLELYFKAHAHGEHSTLYFDQKFVETFLNAMSLRNLESFESFWRDIERCLATPDLGQSFKSILVQLQQRLSEVSQELWKYGLSKNHLTSIVERRM